MKTLQEYYADQTSAIERVWKRGYDDYKAAVKDQKQATGKIKGPVKDDKNWGGAYLQPALDAGKEALVLSVLEDVQALAEKLGHTDMVEAISAQIEELF